MSGLCPKNHTHRHGESKTCYWYGCRCDLCREFVIEQQYYWRAMRRAGRYKGPDLVSTVGVTRRVQALALLGWSGESIAHRAGMSGARLREIMRFDRIERATLHRVAEVYDDLWATPAPVSPSSLRTRTIAHKRGWAPALAWDDDTIDDPAALPAVAVDVDTVDEMAVELALSGERPHLTAVERHIVVRRLHAIRWSDTKIANHLGVSDQTIYRDRKHLGIPAWDQTELEAA